MCVVAGCVLWDKVVIAADCRLARKGKYFDNALKLRRIGPWSLLGFVGNDMTAAATMLGLVLTQAQGRLREGIEQTPGHRLIAAHPLRLARWLPRVLRWAYGQVKTTERLDFMHAYVVPHVPTILHRAELDALFRVVTDSRSAVPPWLPQKCRAAAQSASQSVLVGGSFVGHLQVMESHLDFRPRFERALGFEAIGSGASAVMETIATPTYGNMIFAGGAFAGFAFDAAIDTAIKRAGIRDVGGMRDTYEISSNGVQAISNRTGMQGDVLAVTEDPGRGWIQRNETSGVEAPIHPLSVALEELSQGRGRGIFTDATYKF